MVTLRACLIIVILISLFQAPLNFQRLSLLWSTSGSEDSEAVNHYLILFFIPSSSSLPHMPNVEKNADKMNEKSSKDAKESTAKNNANSYNYEEEIWAVVGRLATEFSEPGFVFSWIKGYVFL